MPKAPSRTALALALAAAWAVPLPAAAPRVEELLGRAGLYVTDFVQRFTSIVAEERFVQDARRVSVPSGKKGNGKALSAQDVAVHRELVSDYLLVKGSEDGGWHSFRDVIEVDGRAVADRTDRLTELFLKPSDGALARAAEVDRESTKHNLGDPVRTINNPLLVLGFLQRQYQGRFKFSLRGQDPELGPDVWVVEYREQARPTLLRRFPDGDLPARGHAWIEGQTGRIVRTELAVSDNDEIITSFRFDERLRIALPVEMRESYWSGGEYVVGTARYGRFRQFGVQTIETVDTDQLK